MAVHAERMPSCEKGLRKQAIYSTERQNRLKRDDAVGRTGAVTKIGPRMSLRRPPGPWATWLSSEHAGFQRGGVVEIVRSGYRPLSRIADDERGHWHGIVGRSRAIGR